MLSLIHICDALRLEEHEQFNRKIVASAPVGICILRTADGVNILSNELAHTYLLSLIHISMISAICIPNASKFQKPSPHIFTMLIGVCGKRGSVCRLSSVMPRKVAYCVWRCV